MKNINTADRTIKTIDPTIKTINAAIKIIQPAISRDHGVIKTIKTVGTINRVDQGSM